MILRHITCVDQSLNESCCKCVLIAELCLAMPCHTYHRHCLYTKLGVEICNAQTLCIASCSTCCIANTASHVLYFCDRVVLLLWVPDDMCLYAQLDALTVSTLPFQQVGAIGKFEGKGGVGLPGSDGVKGQHLLPFLPAFTAFVSRLQDLLVGLLYPGSPVHLLPSTFCCTHFEAGLTLDDNTSSMLSQQALHCIHKVVYVSKEQGNGCEPQRLTPGKQHAAACCPAMYADAKKQKHADTTTRLYSVYFVRSTAVSIRLTAK